MAYLPCCFVGGFNRSFKCEMWCRQLIVTQASCIIHMLSNEIGGSVCAMNEILHGMNFLEGFLKMGRGVS